MSKRVLAFILLVSLLTVFVAQADDEESHPGISIESLYAEASVDYQHGELEAALAVLEHILAKQPLHRQALELKALCLKGHDDRRALEIYQRLVRISPMKDRGPYYFDLGVVLRNLGEESDAIEAFKGALALNFNVTASHFFLGMLYFTSGDPKKSESHFIDSLQNTLPEMKVAALYYLGVLFYKEGYPSLGTTYLLESEKLARTIPESKVTIQTLASIEQILHPFKKGRWFANLSLMVQYDTNISEVPGSIGTEAQASNNATVQSILSAGVGYMSPAYDIIQWIPSYQVSWNENYNSNTQEFDFFTNTMSLYMNYKPLAPFTWGVKLQGSFIFNNAPDDTNNPGGSSTYNEYLLAGSMGPYFKWQLNRHLQLQGEFDVQPQDYFTEPFSGIDYLGKVTLQAETGTGWLAPGLSAWYEDDYATNTEYLFHSKGAGIYNIFRPTIRDSINLGVDYMNYNYVDSSGGRVDNTWSPKMTYLHTFDDKWSLIADCSYTTNASTEGNAYSYNRWVFGAGANYTF